jgi:RNA polymerase sigma-70 factor (ECF subfamily)
MITTCTDHVTKLILAQEQTLLQLARRFTRCDADAEDLVQEALLRAYRARHRFQPGTSIRAWTNTILRRVFLTDVARNKRRALENDTDSGENLDRTAGRAWDAYEPTDVLDEKRLGERLDDSFKRSLERVPEVYRVPFLMSVVEDLTCAEIAERLKIPEGTVMSRIHRARERLKRDLVYGSLAATTPVPRKKSAA